MTLSQLADTLAAAAISLTGPSGPFEERLLALPHLGTLYAACDPRRSLRYEASRWVSETVVLRGRRARTLDPGDDLRFRARRVRLVVSSRTKPQDVRAHVRMVVDGACVVRSASVRVSTTVR